MTTTKVIIADVKVTTREVELPEKCPGCDKLLRECNLTGWEYQDQSRPVRVLEGGTIGDVDCDSVPEGGESFISYIAIVCACGHFLVEGG